MTSSVVMSRCSQSCGHAFTSSRGIARTASRPRSTPPHHHLRSPSCPFCKTELDPVLERSAIMKSPGPTRIRRSTLTPLQRFLEQLQVPDVRLERDVEEDVDHRD